METSGEGLSRNRVGATGVDRRDGVGTVGEVDTAADAGTIGHVAAALGLTPPAIRYYEEIGLVRPERAPNGYRVFSPTDVADLRFAIRAKSLGLSLGEIRTLLDYARGRHCATLNAELYGMLQGKLAEIDCRIRELEGLKADIEAWIPAIGNVGSSTPPDATQCQCLPAKAMPLGRADRHWRSAT
jgi:DNA-binding transcriptional MerR regulator